MESITYRYEFKYPNFANKDNLSVSDIDKIANEYGFNVINNEIYNTTYFNKYGIYLSKKAFPLITFINNYKDDQHSDERFSRMKVELESIGCKIIELKASINIELLKEKLYKTTQEIDNNCSSLSFLVVNRGKNFREVFNGLFDYLSVKDCTLILTDPYLGDKKNVDNEHIETLINIIKSKKPKKVIYLGYSCDSLLKGNVKLDTCEFKHIKIGKENKNGRVDREFHDRYYINYEKKLGFFSGTSINGLIKNICLADKISSDDTMKIIEFLEDNFINKFDI